MGLGTRTKLGAEHVLCRPTETPPCLAIPHFACIGGSSSLPKKLFTQSLNFFRINLNK